MLFSSITSTNFLYILYGTSLFLLGVSIAAKDKKGSDLKIARSLWMLGAFGLISGGHEWLEFALKVEGANLSMRQILAVKSAAALLILVSCVMLLQFGISLVRTLDDQRGRWVKALPVPILLLWAVLLWQYGLRGDGLHIDLHFLRQAEAGAKYTFGIAGGLVTAYGLIVYSREVKPLSSPVSKKLYYAGIAFVFYAVFAGFFSTRYLISYVPFPVKLLRSFSALSIMYFIIGALNIFEVETKKKIEQHMKRAAQVEKLSSLGQLAAGVAHEINNPLTKASLAIQRLKSGAENAGTEPTIRKQLDAIEKSIDQASVVAQELLQSSNVGKLEFVTCDISRAVKGALTLLQYRLGKVTVRDECRPLPAVMGDPAKLEQVFANILFNAAEAMPTGGEVTVSTSQAEDRVEVMITDTGAGIPKERLDRIFDPFFSTKETGVGTGLGLSIAHSIILQHRGRIDVASEPGKGTIVVVSVPTKERFNEILAQRSDHKS